MQSGVDLSTAKITFDTIYQLAKNKNEPGLAAFLQNGICVNTCYGGYTPISLLAEQGSFEAVWLLTNRFKADKNWAVYGAARGRHLDIMHQLIEQDACVNVAVRGAAHGGHFDIMNQLIKEGANLNNAAYGAALGGHHDIMHLLIEQGASRDVAVIGAAQTGHLDTMYQLIKEGAPLNYAVCGAALGGHHDIMHQLIKQGASIDDAVDGATRGGYFDIMNELIKQGASLDYAVQGAVDGGHFDTMNQLIKQGASIDCAMKSVAEGGHADIMNQLLMQGASKDTAVFGAALGGQHELLNQLMKQNLESLCWVEKGAIQNGHLKKQRCLRYISCIDDPALRSILAIRANEGDETINVDLLQEKSGRRNRIMNEYHLNYHQAQALTAPNAIMWILQGRHLVSTGQIVDDIFFKITRFAIGLSPQDTKQFFYAINQKLFANLLSPSSFYFFKPSSQIIDDEKIGNEEDIAERNETGKILGKRNFSSI
jgi:ankyrin repeat protein